MESSEGDKFVDHKETVLSAPRPRKLNALKVDITPEDAWNSENLEAAVGSVSKEFQMSVSKMEETDWSEDHQKEQEATIATSSKKESFGNNTSSSEDKAVVVQESSSSKSEVSSSKTVKTYATTVYTRRISGRKSRFSDSDGDINSPTTKTTNASLPSSTAPVQVHSPKKICSVQFNVAAGVGFSMTTALSKMFTKTVETTTEVSSKERHLSECSFSIGGRADRLPSQETGLSDSTDDQSADKEDTGDEKTENQENVKDDAVFTEVFSPTKSEEEKDVAEYSPGLAIRNLTLEDLQEKRLTPERDTELSSSPVQVTDMSTTHLSPQSLSPTQGNGIFSSSQADSAGGNMSLPVGMSGEGTLSSSEYNTSQLMASESTSITMSAQSSSLTSGGQILMQCTEDFSTAHRKPLFNPIEVERKFTMTEHTEEQLKSLGARLHKEKSFTDIYYDNDEFALIVTDCWLRRRNDSWEAKVPLKTQNREAVFSPASQYKEIRSEREISTWLVDQLRLETWMKGDPIDLLIQAAGLTEFAKFTTTRRTYTLPSCMVDLDLTDNGFQVGEIDVMAASPEELPQALQTISNVAKQLGAKGRNPPLIQQMLYLLLLSLGIVSTSACTSADSSVT